MKRTSIFRKTYLAVIGSAFVASGCGNDNDEAKTVSQQQEPQPTAPGTQQPPTTPPTGTATTPPAPAATPRDQAPGFLQPMQEAIDRLSQQTDRLARQASEITDRMVGSGERVAQDVGLAGRGAAGPGQAAAASATWPMWPIQTGESAEYLGTFQSDLRRNLKRYFELPLQNEQELIGEARRYVNAIPRGQDEFYKAVEEVGNYVAFHGYDDPERLRRVLVLEDQLNLRVARMNELQADKRAAWRWGSTATGAVLGALTSGLLARTNPELFRVASVKPPQVRPGSPGEARAAAESVGLGDDAVQAGAKAGDEAGGTSGAANASDEYRPFKAEVAREVNVTPGRSFTWGERALRGSVLGVPIGAGLGLGVGSIASMMVDDYEVRPLTVLPPLGENWRRDAEVSTIVRDYESFMTSQGSLAQMRTEAEALSNELLQQPDRFPYRWNVIRKVYTEQYGTPSGPAAGVGATTGARQGQEYQNRMLELENVLTQSISTHNEKVYQQDNSARGLVTGLGALVGAGTFWAVSRYGYHSPMPRTYLLSLAAGAATGSVLGWYISPIVYKLDENRYISLDVPSTLDD